MGKLDQLKDWYSLEAALYRLREKSNQNVSFVDLVDVITAGHLRLSCYMLSQKGQKTATGQNIFTPERVWGDAPRFQSKPENAEILEGPYRIDLKDNPIIKLDLMSLVIGEKNGFCELHTLVVRDEDENAWDVLQFDEVGLDGKGGYLPTLIMPAFSQLGIRRVDFEAFEILLDKKGHNKVTMGLREKTTCFNIIHAQQKLLLEKTSGNPALYDSAAAIIAEILALDGIPRNGGISERTLQEKFAKAKRTWESA